jgi:hypothetical protein
MPGQEDWALDNAPMSQAVVVFPQHLACSPALRVLPASESAWPSLGYGSTSRRLTPRCNLVYLSKKSDKAAPLFKAGNLDGTPPQPSMTFLGPL